MKTKLLSPTPEEDAAITRAIAADPDAAPDMSAPQPGFARLGRPPIARPKISVTLRLDQDIVERFKAKGQGWQTRINAALRKNRTG